MASYSEHRFPTEWRLRIAIASLESIRYPKQFFPAENEFCLLPSHKDPFFDCYIAHITQKCSNFIIPVSFSMYLTCLLKLLWEWEMLCAYSASYCTSTRGGASFWVKSWLIGSLLEITNQLSTLLSFMWTSGIAQSKLKKQRNPSLKFWMFYSLLSVAVPLWICWHFKLYFEISYCKYLLYSKFYIKLSPLHTISMKVLPFFFPEAF